MNKNEIIKVLFEQYYDCEKITRTNAGIITDEQRAISENNFNMLVERFFSILEKQSDASETGCDEFEEKVNKVSICEHVFIGGILKSGKVVGNCMKCGKTQEQIDYKCAGCGLPTDGLGYCTNGCDDY